MPTFDPHVPDADLVSAILAGNREAFVQLVERYQQSLRAAARSRLGREDWADDVVQETFLCLLKWLRTYDSRFNFRTWLWTVLGGTVARAVCGVEVGLDHLALRRRRSPGIRIRPGILPGEVFSGWRRRTMTGRDR